MEIVKDKVEEEEETINLKLNNDFGKKLIEPPSKSIMEMLKR